VNIINKNPYRILGVISNASKSEIKNSEKTIKRYSEIGASPKLEYDFIPGLNDINRTKEILYQANNNLHNDLDKIIYALFWFIDGNDFDSIGLDYLKKTNLNIAKSLDTFYKSSRKFAVSERSFSSIINHSTLDILLFKEHKDFERLKNALNHKFTVIHDQETFLKLEQLLTGFKNRININELSKKLLNQSKELLKNLFPRRDQEKLLLDIFKDNTHLKSEVKEQVINHILGKLTELKSKSQIEYDSHTSNKTSKQIRSNRATICSIGSKLINSSRPFLKKLSTLLGKESYQFTSITDEIYNLVNFCGIVPYNKQMDIIDKETQYGMKAEIQKTNFNSSIVLFRSSIEELTFYDVPVKETLKNNLKIIEKVNKQIQEIKNQSPTRKTTPNQTSTRRTTPNQTTQVEDNSGCWMFIGIAILVLIMTNC